MRLIKSADNNYLFFSRQADTKKSYRGRYLGLCEHCNEAFRASRISAKYCSARCRVAASRAKQPKRSQSEITAARLATKREQVHKKDCVWCGDVFVIDGTQTRREFCSNACKQHEYRYRISARPW